MYAQLACVLNCFWSTFLKCQHWTRPLFRNTNNFWRWQKQTEKKNCRSCELRFEILGIKANFYFCVKWKIRCSLCTTQKNLTTCRDNVKRKICDWSTLWWMWAGPRVMPMERVFTKCRLLAPDGYTQQLFTIKVVEHSPVPAFFFLEWMQIWAISTVTHFRRKPKTLANNCEPRNPS